MRSACYAGGRSGPYGTLTLACRRQIGKRLGCSPTCVGFAVLAVLADTKWPKQKRIPAKGDFLRPLIARHRRAKSGNSCRASKLLAEPIHIADGEADAVRFLFIAKAMKLQETVRTRIPPARPPSGREIGHRHQLAQLAHAHI